MASSTISSGCFLQWVGAALLLLLIPLAQGEDLDELSWAQGNTIDDLVPPHEQSFMFLPQQLAAVERAKRTGLIRRTGGVHSLSVVAPLEALRNKLMLDISRKQKFDKNRGQIMANREVLNNVGKRDGSFSLQNDFPSFWYRRQERNARQEDDSTSTQNHEKKSISATNIP